MMHDDEDATQALAWRKALGAELRAMREEAGLSRLELSREAKLSVYFLIRIELGAQFPSVPVLLRLLRVLRRYAVAVAPFLGKVLAAKAPEVVS